MESSRLSARLAGYVEAIKEARGGGVTWQQLGDLFGAKGKTMAAAYKVAAGGKYVVREQKLLPVKEVVDQRSSAPARNDEQQPEVSNRRKLARLDGGNQKPESEMSEAERVIASMHHI